MPKSKRNKMVSLTKVKKRGREGKEELLEKVQECFTEYKHSYVLSFHNMRSVSFKTMQAQMHDTTKFFLGKNKVMMKALGTQPEDELADNTSQLSRYLHGQVCLAFSNLGKKEFFEELSKFEADDYA